MDLQNGYLPRVVSIACKTLHDQSRNYVGGAYMNADTLLAFYSDGDEQVAVSLFDCVDPAYRIPAPVWIHNAFTSQNVLYIVL